MGQDPSTIRQQVETTRERMGETVEALAYKADVPSRAKDTVTGRVDSLKAKVTGATPDGDQVAGQAKRAVGVAQENPLGLALGAVALGFLGGLLLPSTRVENEKLGPAADHVKDQVKDVAQTAAEHGKEAVSDAASAAGAAAKDAGQQHAQEAKSDLRDQAQQAGDQVRTSA
ncbi:MAG: DUF3618 domain-containing protein [Solirubrobacteraceae bacterium]